MTPTNTPPPDDQIPNPRFALLGWLAFYIGGWNASAGSHPGRLVFDVDCENDEEVIKHLLNAHESNVAHPLQKEIKELKSKIYDLQNP